MSGGSPGDGVLGPGLVLGDIVLGEELGRGAQGVVFAGTDAAGRSLALKFIRPEDEGQAARAEREAVALARVKRHPHILELHAARRWGPYLILVLERVDAPDLATMLASRGAMGEREAAGLLAPIAEALAFIHDQGLTHRDVKPANILVRDDERGALLSDFGLVRGAGLQTITRTQDMVGTPAYMAPEQLDPSLGEVGPAADVWALSIILVELATGAHPFASSTGVELMARILGAEPTPSTRGGAAMTPALRELALAGLRRAAAERPSAAELAEELRRFAAGQGRGALRGGRAPGLILAGLILAGLVLAGLLAMFSAWPSRGPAPEPEHRDAPRLGALPASGRPWAGAALLLAAGEGAPGEAAPDARALLDAIPPGHAGWSAALEAAARGEAVAREGALGLFESGCAALRRERWEQAAARFEELLRSPRWEAPARLGLALAELRRGRFEAAEAQLFGLAIAGLDASLEALRARVAVGPLVAAFREGDRRGAIAGWQRAMDGGWSPAEAVEQLQAALDALPDAEAQARAFTTWEAITSAPASQDPGRLRASPAVHAWLLDGAVERAGRSWQVVHAALAVPPSEVAERLGQAEGALFEWHLLSPQRSEAESRRVYLSLWRLCREGLVLTFLDFFSALDARGDFREIIAEHPEDPIPRFFRYKCEVERLIRDKDEVARAALLAHAESDLEVILREGPARGLDELVSQALAMRALLLTQGELATGELTPEAAELALESGRAALARGLQSPHMQARVERGLAIILGLTERPLEGAEMLEGLLAKLADPSWLRTSQFASAASSATTVRDVMVERASFLALGGKHEAALEQAREAWRHIQTASEVETISGTKLAQVFLTCHMALDQDDEARAWLATFDGHLTHEAYYRQGVLKLRRRLR